MVLRNSDPVNCRSGVLVYYALLMLIVVRTSLEGDRSGLWAVHGFGAAVIIVAAWRGGLIGDLVDAARRPAAWALFAFLAYFALMAALHPTVSDVYFRHLARDIGPALLFGVIVFGSGRFPRRVEAFAAIFALAVLALCTAMLWNALRPDIFLARPFPGERLAYQAFGINLVMFVVTLIAIAATYAGPWAKKREWVWALGTPTLFVVAFFVAQMIGSNLASALLFVAALTIGITGLWHYRSDWHGAGRIATGGVAGLALVGIVLATAPPMRFMAFKAPAQIATPGNVTSVRPAPCAASTPAPARSVMHNVDQRIDLARHHGWQQVAVASITGNLAADRDVTGGAGSYLHSIASVQTHLGLIGSALLLGFLVPGIWRTYKMPRHPVLKISALAILLMSLFAFFIWPPLWFLVGGMIGGMTAHPTPCASKSH